MGMEIEYREIEGHEGYRFGSDGSVGIRWGGARGRRAGVLGAEWRPAKIHVCNGYLRLCLRGAGIQRVNRLVCLAFHGEPPTPRHEAAHLNGDPADNSAANLAWETRKENETDKNRHGTRLRGERHKMAKLTEADVCGVRAAPRFHGSGLAHAKRLGVSPGAISDILAGKRWRMDNRNRGLPPVGQPKKERETCQHQ